MRELHPEDLRSSCGGQNDSQPASDTMTIDISPEVSGFVLFSNVANSVAA